MIITLNRIKEILNNLTNSNPKNETLTSSIGYIASILRDISDRDTFDESKEVVTSYIEVVDLILNISLLNLKTAQNIFNSSNM